MSKTLFWYIFKDLLRIFFMASGALAGIMSFGGLLRPLTQQGLDAGQVVKILNYFMPAMTAYSLPVAALFAATVVYGRLGADNELTACRAGGISHLWIATPAMVLGLFVALVSLTMLCFMVPAYTLKVERVIYSNLARLVANRVERTHEIQFGSANIFARSATVQPPDPRDKSRQQVVLDGVSIMTFDKPDRSDPRYKVPREFYTATSATVTLHQQQEAEVVDLTVGLNGGAKFPRKFFGNSQIYVDVTQFGPIEIPSPIKEDTKFMNLWTLRRMFEHPEESRKIRPMLDSFVHRDQEKAYLGQILGELNGPAHQVVFADEAGQTFRLARLAGPVAAAEKAGLVIPPPPPSTVEGANALPTIRWEQSGQVYDAREAHIRVEPDDENKLEKFFKVTVELKGVVTTGSGEFRHTIDVPMGDALAEIGADPQRALRYYLAGNGPAARDDVFKRELIVLANGIVAETHARASFAVSCFILVMVGCALGMMFRSGNFLSAFAVSFIPALLTITLIVCGQHTAQTVPWKGFEAHNALGLGTSIIWSGNALNFLLAGGLLWRLQKQ